MHVTFLNKGYLVGSQTLSMNLWSIWKCNIVDCVNYAFWLAEISNIFLIRTLCERSLLTYSPLKPLSECVLDGPLPKVLLFVDTTCLCLKVWRTRNINQYLFSTTRNLIESKLCMLHVIHWVCCKITDLKDYTFVYTITYYNVVKMYYQIEIWTRQT